MVKGPAVPSEGPARAAISEVDDQPEVPELNVAAGLPGVAANKKLYRKLLHRFPNTEADAAQRMASALATSLVRMPGPAHPQIAVRTGRSGRRNDPAADAGQVKIAVEHLSRYLAKTDAAAIDYFDSRGVTCERFSAHRSQRFASSIETYVFSEAYEQLTAAAKAEALTE